MNKENKTPKQIADDIVKKIGVENAIELVNTNIDNKRKEKPSALKTIYLVEELNFMQEVKNELLKL